MEIHNNPTKIKPEDLTLNSQKITPTWQTSFKIFKKMSSNSKITINLFKKIILINFIKVIHCLKSISSDAALKTKWNHTSQQQQQGKSTKLKKIPPINKIDAQTQMIQSFNQQFPNTYLKMHRQCSVF